MSTETTFADDLTSVEKCIDELPELLDDLKADLEKQKTMARVSKLFLKLKFSDFKTTTKECGGTELLTKTYISLLEEAFERNPNPVRLLGVGVRFEDVSRLDERQLELFNH